MKSPRSQDLDGFVGEPAFDAAVEHVDHAASARAELDARRFRNWITTDGFALFVGQMGFADDQDADARFEPQMAGAEVERDERGERHRAGGHQQDTGEVSGASGAAA